jgi:hypothetical protein
MRKEVMEIPWMKNSEFKIQISRKMQRLMQLCGGEKNSSGKMPEERTGAGCPSYAFACALAVEEGEFEVGFGDYLAVD